MPELHGIDVSHNNLLNQGKIDWHAVATLAAYALLLMAEGFAAWRPDHARRTLVLALVIFFFVAVDRVDKVSATDVASARPRGAFITAGAMVVLALAGLAIAIGMKK